MNPDFESRRLAWMVADSGADPYKARRAAGDSLSMLRVISVRDQLGGGVGTIPAAPGGAVFVPTTDSTWNTGGLVMPAVPVRVEIDGSLAPLGTAFEAEPGLRPFEWGKTVRGLMSPDRPAEGTYGFVIRGARPGTLTNNLFISATATLVSHFAGPGAPLRSSIVHDIDPDGSVSATLRAGVHGVLIVRPAVSVREPVTVLNLVRPPGGAITPGVSVGETSAEAGLRTALLGAAGLAIPDGGGGGSPLGADTLAGGGRFYDGTAVGRARHVILADGPAALPGHIYGELDGVQENIGYLRADSVIKFVGSPLAGPVNYEDTAFGIAPLGIGIIKGPKWRVDLGVSHTMEGMSDTGMRHLIHTDLVAPPEDGPPDQPVDRPPAQPTQQITPAQVPPGAVSPVSVHVAGDGGGLGDHEGQDVSGVRPAEAPVEMACASHQLVGPVSPVLESVVDPTSHGDYWNPYSGDGYAIGSPSERAPVTVHEQPFYEQQSGQFVPLSRHEQLSTKRAASKGGVAVLPAEVDLTRAGHVLEPATAVQVRPGRVYHPATYLAHGLPDATGDAVDGFRWLMGGSAGVRSMTLQSILAAGTAVNYYDLVLDAHVATGGKLSFGNVTTVTQSGSSMVYNNSVIHEVSDGGAPANLDTITAPDNGGLIIVRAASGSSITVRDDSVSGAGSTGIRTCGAAPATLAATDHAWLGYYDSSTQRWVELARNVT